MHQGAVNAARIAQKVGSESLKQSRLISESSERQSDQEAAEQYESFVVNRVEGACAGTAQKSVDFIRKKTRDIKNTRDVKSNVRTIRKADTTVRTSAKATEYARKTADEIAKQAVITTEKIMPHPTTAVLIRLSTGTTSETTIAAVYLNYTQGISPSSGKTECLSASDCLYEIITCFDEFCYICFPDTVRCKRYADFIQFINQCAHVIFTPGFYVIPFIF